MIKKSVFENDLIEGMQRELKAQKKPEANLSHALECLNSAAEIFDDMGLFAQSDKVLGVIAKLAQKSDPHTKGLTSEKMIKNYLDHGTAFNLSDDGADVLDADVEDPEMTIDEDKALSNMDFEDEL